MPTTDANLELRACVRPRLQRVEEAAEVVMLRLRWSQTMKSGRFSASSLIVFIKAEPRYKHLSSAHFVEPC